MSATAHELRGHITEHCREISEHLKLLRDYATTPGDTWLARGELNIISEQVGELEALLAQLKQADE